MPTSAALTLWVASSQIALPITGAVARAAGEILGSDVRVQTAAYPDDHPEAVRAPIAGERSVQVSWSTNEFSGAHLKLCRAADDCFERWVSFRPNDPELERGRTVGFLAASVFLENPPSAAPAADRAAPPAQPPKAAPPPKAFVSAAVAVAAPGDGTGLGARLAGGYAGVPSLRLGVGIEARFGELPEVQATSRVLSPQVMAAFTLVRPAPLGLAFELDLGAYQLLVTHLSDDDPEPVRESRWLFGGDACVDFHALLNGFSTIFVAPGVEVLSGSTEISVHGRTSATWPVAIPILRAGLRAAF